MQYYFFSGVVDIINDPRHQLIINKAQTPLGPRQSNFCHSDNYILFFSSLTFSPRFWEPRDPPQPGFFLEAIERTLGRTLVVLQNLATDC